MSNLRLRNCLEFLLSFSFICWQHFLPDVGGFAFLSFSCKSNADSCWSDFQLPSSCSLFDSPRMRTLLIFVFNVTTRFLFLLTQSRCLTFCVCFRSCPEIKLAPVSDSYEFVHDDEAEGDSNKRPLISKLSGRKNVMVIVLLAMLCVLLGGVVIFLTSKVLKLRKRPRIRKRIVVNRPPPAPFRRPSAPHEQCEITIENCCNMNICDTVSVPLIRVDVNEELLGHSWTESLRRCWVRQKGLVQDVVEWNKLMVRVVHHGLRLASRKWSRRLCYPKMSRDTSCTRPSSFTHYNYVCYWKV